jgi:hypothetical protein
MTSSNVAPLPPRLRVDAINRGVDEFGIPLEDNGRLFAESDASLRDALDAIDAFNNPGVFSSGRGYTSFSGADIRALIAVPSDGRGPPILKVLANLQTISYSVVRALGFVGEKGRVRGGRTVAGSMVFTVFDRHVLFDIMRIKSGDNARNNTGLSSLDLGHILVDQLPLFDVIINFSNEYGHSAQMAIIGCDIHSEGQVMSIQDMLTENTVQYTAQHIALMTPGSLTSLYQQRGYEGERTVGRARAASLYGPDPRSYGNLENYPLTKEAQLGSYIQLLARRGEIR